MNENLTPKMLSFSVGDFFRRAFGCFLPGRFFGAALWCANEQREGPALTGFKLGGLPLLECRVPTLSKGPVANEMLY